MQIKNFEFTQLFLILKYQFSYLNNKFQSSNINFQIHQYEQYTYICITNIHTNIYL